MGEQRIYCPKMLKNPKYSFEVECSQCNNFSSEEINQGTIIYDGKKYSCIGLKEGKECAQITSLNKLDNIEKKLSKIFNKKK